MQDFRFTNTSSRRNIGAAADLLVQPRLWIPGGDYPGHREWVDKAVSQIGEQKIAMVAFWGRVGVGTLVYQRHREDPTKVEIKNLSVEPYARGRLVASFMLRQVEAEAPNEFPGVTAILGDTKITNRGIINFVVEQGYAALPPSKVEGSFAHNGVPDVTFIKPLSPLAIA